MGPRATTHVKPSTLGEAEPEETEESVIAAGVAAGGNAAKWMEGERQDGVT